MFIPVTPKEVKERGWDGLDVILVSGDTYADTSYNGSAVIGHWLIGNGLRVGMIPQPDTDSPEDITRLGAPSLFWGVSAGCVDSMVANYSATKKRRKDDDFTPGGINDRRPDRACIVYSNLIRKHFKGSTVVLGGIEASLRRIAHYDMWSDNVRRSILFDAKADAITYGMAELSNLRLAEAIKKGEDWKDIKGICHASKEKKKGYLELPSFERVSANAKDFAEAFRTFYDNNDPVNAVGLIQAHGDRYLIHNPPSEHLTTEVLDRIYGSDYENRVHPFCAKGGAVRSMETVKQSITTHRGCYGECNFCAIAVHQGRTVISRSEESIVREAERIASKKGFNGIIYDVGGPTANMYGIECIRKLRMGSCKDKRCMYPKICDKLAVDHGKLISLLEKISNVPNVKKVFVASGIRYDMILTDQRNGKRYVDRIVKEHVSGQLKIAPEHISPEVLELMGKPGADELLKFKKMFEASNKEHGKKQFLTYYLIAAHPGCRDSHMTELREFVTKELNIDPEQVQIFTPTPSTYSTMMYHARRDIGDKKDVFAEHSMQMKQRQKDIVTGNR